MLYILILKGIKTVCSYFVFKVAIILYSKLTQLEGQAHHAFKISRNDFPNSRYFKLKP